MLALAPSEIDEPRKRRCGRDDAAAPDHAAAGAPLDAAAALRALEDIALRPREAAAERGALHVSPQPSPCYSCRICTAVLASS